MDRHLDEPLQGSTAHEHQDLERSSQPQITPSDSSSSRLRLFLARVVLATILLIGISIIFIESASKTNYINDFHIHSDFARQLQTTGETASPLPHFLYHVLFIGFSTMLPNASSDLLAAAPVILTNLLTGILLFELLQPEVPRKLFPVIPGILTLSLLMITPILLFVDLPYLIGYINPTSYHNPTQNVLRLFVIPVFLFSLRVLQPQPYKSRVEQIFVISLAFTLTLLMGLSKPSFSICLVPALGLAVFFQLIQRKQVDWSLLIFGLALPMGVMLGFQFISTYVSDSNSSIQVGFFYFFSQLRISNLDVLLRVILSLVFPAAVYLLHFRHARHHTALNFAWLVFAIGLVYMFFFYESGERLNHGNFLWGAYISLFILMIISVRFMLRLYRPLLLSVADIDTLSVFWQIPWRLHLVSCLFMLHAISGGLYYIWFMSL